MLQQPSNLHLVASQRRGLRPLGAALFIVAMLSAVSLHAQDCTQQIREAAKTWGMNQIAVLQAAAGDVQGAKRTLSQIDEEGPKRPAEVTVVWFCNRTPVYENISMSPGWAQPTARVTSAFYSVIGRPISYRRMSRPVCRRII